MQVVLKFGGAALADGSRIRSAMERIAQQAARSAPERAPIVVVSALAGVTDMLAEAAHGASYGRLASDALRIRHRSVLSQLGLASELLDRHWRELRELLHGIAERQRLEPAELDLVLSYGERMSSRILAAALNSDGLDATPVDAWDIGFLTDSNHGRALPVEGIQGPVRQALAAIPGIAVVTGFLAKDRHGRLTTLGRNGSDLTASVLAEAVGADELVFYKDVAGIHSADPRRLSQARLLERVTYAEAAELAFHGARVLHPASVAPAVRARADVWVRPLTGGQAASGTRLVTRLVRPGPVALACRSDQVRLRFPIDQPGRRGPVLARAFVRLEAAGLTPGLIVAGGSALEVYVSQDAKLASLGEDVEVDSGYASVALVGQGIGADRDLAASVLTVLAREQVSIRAAQLGSRAHAQALVLRAADLDRARQLLHDSILVTASHTL